MTKPDTEITKRGVALLRNPSLNKSTAYTEAESRPSGWSGWFRTPRKARTFSCGG